MDSSVTPEKSEKSENTVKAKNTPKPTKTSQSQTYSNRKKSEKQVSTSLKSLTTTGVVANCCQRINIKPLSSEIAAQLAEDTEHRMRELIELAKQFMLHSNRTKLLVDDITRASIHSNAEIDTLPFSLSFLNSTQDVDINLEEVLAKEERSSTTKEGVAGCSWLVLEGNVMDGKKNRGTQVTTTVSSGRTAKNRDNIHLFISSIFSEDSETREFTLSQLATTTWVNRILVEIIHILCDVITSETAGRFRSFALEAVKNILTNKKIFIEPHLLTLTTSMKSLLFIDKPSHFKPNRELLQRIALTNLLYLHKEHATPYNSLEGQLEKEASRLINSIKTHPINLYGHYL
ncbi:Transcription initiation factor TFIID subunit 6-like isoform X1 [Oopsacas minuta]|uniref:Transcription initiation factor TFIID subunit 6-like isoform X1 n=1 Tax=Oopsacas minuta TaxID=111878 RepID=A0AAV7K8G6_9METZ|nr:Transcription initiation factor TFIID subunit 6-like isoform X1 [Oopsacas minuta]